MKLKFSIKIDTQFTVDFTNWTPTHVEQQGGYETMRLLVNYFLAEYGYDHFELSAANCPTLHEAMKEVVKQQTIHHLVNKEDFEYN